MHEDETAGYRLLRDGVARMLPVDASGRRRPPEQAVAGTYWEVGRLLNEHLAGRAAYGQRVMARLAADLGLLPRTLYRARKVHERLPVEASAQLGWSLCRLLVTVDDDSARRRLATRVAAAGWSVRRLQEHLKTAPAEVSVPILSRPGTYRIVSAVDTSGLQGRAVDLGFGIRRPLVLPGKPGKKTRRLLRELEPGDTVECTTDDKGRPAVRRVFGQIDSRLYVYTATGLQVAAAATLCLQLDLGFDVMYECRVSLRPPAHKLSRTALAAATASMALPIVVRSVRHTGDTEYAVDLYRLDDPARPEHFNTLWSHVAHQ
ncbi:MAG: DUF1016 N-terminal domain-containing protein [bacterium]|nr:DUF1016 N-terminal domain-containing protein [bacterium]